MTNPSYRIEVITSVQRRRCWRRSAWSRRPLNRRVHVKDMDSKGEIADVGSGKIDFARIFARSEGRHPSLFRRAGQFCFADSEHRAEHQFLRRLTF